MAKRKSYLAPHGPTPGWDIQKWLIGYLNTEVDPYDFSWMIKEWNPKLGDEVYADDLTDKQLKAFTEWLKNGVAQEWAFKHDPYGSPAYLTMGGAEAVSKGTWLVHFTNESFSDFSQGTTIEGMHLSTWSKNKASVVKGKNLSDDIGTFELVFGFALPADHRGSWQKGPTYGRQAKLFQCDLAVQAYHDGDQEWQIVFPLESEYNVIDIPSYEYDGSMTISTIDEDGYWVDAEYASWSDVVDAAEKGLIEVSNPNV